MLVVAILSRLFQAPLLYLMIHKFTEGFELKLEQWDVRGKTMQKLEIGCVVFNLFTLLTTFANWDKLLSFRFSPGLQCGNGKECSILLQLRRGQLDIGHLLSVSYTTDVRTQTVLHSSNNTTYIYPDRAYETEYEWPGAAAKYQLWYWCSPSRAPLLEHLRIPRSLL